MTQRKETKKSIFASIKDFIIEVISKVSIGLLTTIMLGNLIRFKNSIALHAKDLTKKKC